MRFRTAVGVVDLGRLQVETADGTVALTAREADLLTYLLDHAGRALTRQTLLRDVWGARSNSSRVVDMTVARLRRKIESNPRSPVHLVTHRGIGYRFELGAIEAGEDAHADPADSTGLAALGVCGDVVPIESIGFVLEGTEGPWRTLGALERAGLAVREGDVVRVPGAAEAFRRLPEAERVELVQRWESYVLHGRDSSPLRVAGLRELATTCVRERDLVRARECAASLRRLGVDPSPVIQDLHRVSAPGSDPGALWIRGWLASLEGRLTEAVRSLTEVVQRAEDPVLAVRSRSDLACVLAEQGRLGAAKRMLRAARGLASGAMDPRVLADLASSEGFVALTALDPDAAEAALRRAEQLYTRLDSALGLAWTFNNLGETSRIRGNGSDAATRYRRSVQWFEHAGSSDVVVPRINLALLAHASGEAQRLQRARTTLETALADSVDQARLARAARVGVLLACVLHALGANGEARPVLETACERLHQTGFVDQNVVDQLSTLAGSELGDIAGPAARQARQRLPVTDRSDRSG